MNDASSEHIVYDSYFHITENKKIQLIAEFSSIEELAKIVDLSYDEVLFIKTELISNVYIPNKQPVEYLLHRLRKSSS
jgi:hypothetical protein